MRSVWVVDSGDYSDYRVNKIFSTKELAERWVNGDPEFDIYEWPLDDDKEMIRRKCYSTTIYFVPYKSFRGEFKVGEINSGYVSFEEALPTARIKPAILGNQNEFLITYSYISQEHANKLAIEGYQAWLRHRKLEEFILKAGE